jgi:VWFA-related protein
MAVLLDMSSSMTPNLSIVKRAASRLVEGLRPEDEAQIVQFSDRPVVLQDFTADRAKLMTAVAGARAAGGTALHNALYVTLKEMESRAKSEEMRRRAIVLLSDGLDTRSTVTDERVLEAARACETNVYSILLGGTGDDRGAGSDDARARYLLGSLARESGGQAFYPRTVGELARIYDRVAEELRSQYNIGYVSTNPAIDGAWRQVLVMTPGQGKLRVRHRLGYYALPGAPLAKARISQATTAATPQ